MCVVLKDVGDQLVRAARVDVTQVKEWRANNPLSHFYNFIIGCTVYDTLNCAAVEIDDRILMTGVKREAFGSL